MDVYSKKEAGKEQDRVTKYWIRPASLTVEAKQSEIAELFEKFAAMPFIDRINNRASMEHIRRGYLGVSYYIVHLTWSSGNAICPFFNAVSEG